MENNQSTLHEELLPSSDSLQTLVDSGRFDEAEAILGRKLSECFAQGKQNTADHFGLVVDQSTIAYERRDFNHAETLLISVD